MTTTLVVPESIGSVLLGLAQLDVETGAVLLARPAQASNGDFRLLGTQLCLVPSTAYQRRESDQLLITSDGYVPALGLAETAGAVPIWLHTHPGEASSPKPSAHDERVDEQLTDLFRLRSGSQFYGSLIVSHAKGQLRFTGHLDDGSKTIAIDRLLAVGERLSLAWSDFAGLSPLPSLFDRNVRAFGGGVQRVLRDLRIAVVGCGGTGSSVAEQLVRLGVRNIMLIDPDHVTESNLTRLYGSNAGDVGRPKTRVLADHLLRIAPDAQVDCVESSIVVEGAARRLVGRDIVFGCTDDNAGRLVLSRLASYMLIPVIDLGVLLTSNGQGCLDGIHARVTLLYPGAACLVCRGRVDMARARTELLPTAEREHRVGEGYAPALPGVEPAVVAYTTLVGAQGVGELLERLTHYGPEPAPSEVLFRIHEREMSVNMSEPRPGHYCHSSSGKLGAGLTEPFLEQVWAT